jgi:hypothetical protein
MTVLDEVINNADWLLMVNYEAARAGKTFVTTLYFC